MLAKLQTKEQQPAKSMFHRSLCVFGSTGARTKSASWLA